MSTSRKMKLYLAHPVSEREEVRQWELEFERLTGIDLVNPFYDVHRADIEARDNGRSVHKTNAEREQTVERDLKLIDSSDGILALLPKANLGAPMEVFYTTFIKGKPGYAVVSESNLEHPWLVRCETFASRDDLLRRFVPLRMAFVGRLGDGKTTAARYLVEKYHFRQYSFAAKVKEIAVDLFDMDPNKKDRVLLQKLGTDAMRAVFPTVWVDYLARKLKTESPFRAVIDDCRFLNEAEALKSEGFVVVRIVREGQREAEGAGTSAEKHRSETELEGIPYDEKLVASSLDEMHAKLDKLVGKLSDEGLRRQRLNTGGADGKA